MITAPYIYQLIVTMINPIRNIITYLIVVYTSTEARTAEYQFMATVILTWKSSICGIHSLYINSIIVLYCISLSTYCMLMTLCAFTSAGVLIVVAFGVAIGVVVGVLLLVSVLTCMRHRSVNNLLNLLNSLLKNTTNHSIGQEKYKYMYILALYTGQAA